MKTSSSWITIIVIVVVIGAAWSLLDHRSGTPIKPIEASPTASSTPPAAPPSASVPVSNTAAVQNAPAPTTNQSVKTIIKNSMHAITIETNKGTIVFETYDADAPKAVANFIALANKGFYNNLIFHRVISGFMIQGGDPKGDGTGGPGYKFDDELDPNTPSYKAGYVRGTVAMANSGPNTNGSQFFIMHKDYALPNNYTIFGKVVKGIEVVDAIAAVQKDANDKPLQDVVMTKVTVSDK